MSLSTYEIIMQQKKEAKRIAELFRESVVLKNILSDHDLKIMLNEIKKHFEKSGIEFIKNIQLTRLSMNI
jgi:UTP-glucose-1-phosphate uridylyltransferase